MNDNSIRAKVTYAYEAEDETNITIAVGDVVVVSDKSDDDWWEGHVEGKPEKVGFFPASFVEMIEEGAPSDPGSPRSSLGGDAIGGGVDRATVTFEYEAEDE
eukprot:COSAG06_NODE_39637_length_410_cov_1.045016_1_plen_101_part_01